MSVSLFSPQCSNPGCGKTLTTAEEAAYGSVCEDCWACQGGRLLDGNKVTMAERYRVNLPRTNKEKGQQAR